MSRKSRKLAAAQAKAAAIPFSPKGKQAPRWYGSSNRLISSSTQTPDRKYIPSLDSDFHDIISNFGRKTLITVGRRLFWNIPALQGSILEQANLATSTFIPQYRGRNKAWGDVAEPWLNEWHRVMDVAGWPYDYNSYIRSHVILPIVDGDVGTLLTETADGYPLIQVIPAHRIDCSETVVDSGEYYGRRVIDGCIVDDYLRVLAYRLKNDDGTYTDVAARDMFLSFDPIMPGQVRNISALASSAFYWQDVAESREFELIAQKAFSSQTIVETNETGEADAAKSLIALTSNYDGTSGNLTATAQERLDGGTIRYLKANTGSKLEAFDWDRPSANTREFQETIVRDAFRGTEWDSFFSLDPKSVGGAPMRVIVEKINATLEKRRRLVEKACRRVDGYAISKAIKLKLLPFDIDWWKWEYQGPADVTADRKYDSDVDIQEISTGIGTRKEALARRGKYIEEVDAQRLAEADSDLARAKTLADKYGISIQAALTVLTKTGSYSSVTNATVAPPSGDSTEPPTNSDDEK